jgi:hypothetical protein
MDDVPRTPLVLVRGGRAEGQTPVGVPGERVPLRVIPGGPAGGVEADIEEAIAAARRMRLEIQARIARALADTPPPSP